ncbi:MAG: polyphosphate kinase 2 family protein [Bacteroidales bacterium]|nr:polyphosphate kinase 2 family protein [Bacteroidales bacterium]
MENFLHNPSIMAVPGKKHHVSDFDCKYTAHLTNKKETVEQLKENVDALIDEQGRLYADNRYAVLLVFQAMDAAGKDGTIKHVMSGLNPQGTQVYSFKTPTDIELEHEYLWRTNRFLPQRGNFGIFNRSYYEEVLIVKVHPEYLLRQLLPNVKKVEDAGKEFWTRRYRQINDMERHLTENGTIVLKFFLNVSKDEQKKRFLKRIEDDSRNWKFSPADVKERQYWDQYMEAYSDLITNTSTETAPWYVIPADNKWFMRYAVSNVIINKLRELDLQYPHLPEVEKNRLEEAKKMLMNE